MKNLKISAGAGRQNSKIKDNSQMLNNQVILVDENDQELGVIGKKIAHTGSGNLHRAVSVLIYRKNNASTELLIQKRSSLKALWPLFWSNTICTHPESASNLVDCAVVRLRDELGIDIAPSALTFVFKLRYQAQYNQTSAENELDHVFVGKWDGKVKKNPEEVQAYKWIETNKLLKHLESKPTIYTPWFHLIVKNPLIQREIL